MWVVKSTFVCGMVFFIFLCWYRSDRFICVFIFHQMPIKWILFLSYWIRWYFFLFFCWINSLLDRFIQVRYLWDYDYGFMGHPFPWLDCFLLITCVECNSKFLWIDSSSSFVLSFGRLSYLEKVEQQPCMSTKIVKILGMLSLYHYFLISFSV